MEESNKEQKEDKRKRELKSSKKKQKKKRAQSKNGFLKSNINATNIPASLQAFGTNWKQGIVFLANARTSPTQL